MRLRIGYEIVLDVPTPIPVLTLLRVHPSAEAELVYPETPKIEPRLPVAEYFDVFGNRVGKLLVPAGKLRLTNDALIRVDGRPDPVAASAFQHPVIDLPSETLQFLLPSRYCEVDRLGDVAWSLFGKTPFGWARVQAVCDWVHKHVEFGYSYADSTKGAYETYLSPMGVCRDFTHLAITFCRCLGIPARYVTGYLGDIGVPVDPNPMDFSAWFEVYLGGTWHTFDARHNARRIGRVVMARGRDAVDVALTTSFGEAKLEKFAVWTDEVPEH
jgi:transglutaminase-like putative cysteine protease